MHYFYQSLAHHGAVGWSAMCVIAVFVNVEFPSHTRFSKMGFVGINAKILWFGLVCCFTSPGNSYGHFRTVSSPSHTFSRMGKLEQADNQYFEHILSLVTDNNPS